MVDLSGFIHDTEEDVRNHLHKAVLNYEPEEWIVCKEFAPILIEGLKMLDISFLIVAGSRAE